VVTDDLKEAIEHIRKHAIEEFGLQPRAPRPSRMLGEDGYPVVITDQAP
jgi:hypothetical protein